MKRKNSDNDTKTIFVKTDKSLEEYMLETFGVAATPANELPDEEPELKAVIDIEED